MSRKSKIPDGRDLAWARDRLWDWLVTKAGAKVPIPDTTLERWGEAAQIEAKEARKAGNPPRTRPGAAARAFWNLTFSAAQRDATNAPTIPTTAFGKKQLLSYLVFRAKAIAEATEGAQAVTRLRKLARDLAAWAGAEYKRQFPSGKPDLLVHSASEVASSLAALDKGLAKALDVIGNCHATVATMGESGHVWGSDLDPARLPKLDAIALDLADGGFTSAEIGDLLDPLITANPKTKEKRWQKRIERARRATDNRRRSRRP